MQQLRIPVQQCRPAVSEKVPTGKERDDETGFDYFGARYYNYNPALGRWMSVDPLSDKYPGWSPYNYVLNNPLGFVDPDGRDVWFVHGTFATQRTWEDEGMAGWEAHLDDVRAEPFSWSGGNNHYARVEAAEKIVEAILADYGEGMEINIVAHSHGGNVAILAANILAKEHGLQVDNLITIATPSIVGYRLSEGAVSSHTNIYSKHDAVQVLGGFDTVPVPTAPGVMHVGTLAGRAHPSANNINASSFTSRRPLRAHSQMHNNVNMIRQLFP